MISTLRVAILSLLCCVSASAQDSAARQNPADSAARVARAQKFYQQGQAYLARGERDSARLAWESAVGLDHDNVPAIVDLARLLVADGYAGNAQVLLTLAIKRHPNDPRLLHFSAVRDTAGVRYDSLLNKPEPPEATFRAAASQALGMGLYPRASDIVVRGLALYPHSNSLRALADSARKLGDRQQ